jgi:hypothetical protein
VVESQTALQWLLQQENMGDIERVQHYNSQTNKDKTNTSN